MSDDAKPAVLVIGLGSPFRADDAFGPAVVAALREGWDFSAGVRLADGGTPGLDLLALLSGAPHVLVVDAVSSGGEPGTLRIFRKEDLLRQAPSRRVSAHSVDLPETIRLLERAGLSPETVALVGVEPASVEAGRPMSPVVRAAVPEAAKAVVRLLAEFGCPSTPRAGLR